MVYRVSEHGRRTQSVVKNFDPEWNETFVYSDISVDKVYTVLAN